MLEDEKKNIYNQEPIDNFDLSQEKRGLAEVKNKMGDLGKKIQNKQIAELSASQKSDKIEKSLSQLSDKNQEYSMKKSKNRIINTNYFSFYQSLKLYIKNFKNFIIFFINFL